MIATSCQFIIVVVISVSMVGEITALNVLFTVAIVNIVIFSWFIQCSKYYTLSDPNNVDVMVMFDKVVRCSVFNANQLRIRNASICRMDRYNPKNV